MVFLGFSFPFMVISINHSGNTGASPSLVATSPDKGLAAAD